MLIASIHTSSVFMTSASIPSTTCISAWGQRSGDGRPEDPQRCFNGTNTGPVPAPGRACHPSKGTRNGFATRQTSIRRGQGLLRAWYLSRFGQLAAGVAGRGVRSEVGVCRVSDNRGLGWVQDGAAGRGLACSGLGCRQDPQGPQSSVQWGSTGSVGKGELEQVYSLCAPPPHPGGEIPFGLRLLNGASGRTVGRSTEKRGPESSWAWVPAEQTGARLFEGTGRRTGKGGARQKGCG